MSNIQKKLVELTTSNWKPKLACLAIAVVIWLVVDVFYVQPSSNKVWNLDDIRIALPD